MTASGVPGLPGVEERLRAALREALRSRDRVATAALRSVLAALDNSTAVPVAPRPAAGGAGSVHVAGGVAGLGAGEVPRRELTAAETAAVLRAEIAERRAAAAAYPPDAAARLHAEADLLATFLD